MATARSLVNSFQLTALTDVSRRKRERAAWGTGVGRFGRAPSLAKLLAFAFRRIQSAIAIEAEPLLLGR